MSKKFVIFIDTQADFMLSTGALYVQGAESIVGGLVRYAYDLDAAETAGVLFTFDTHRTETYPDMPESQQFPIHCVEGTTGWMNVVSYKMINNNIPTYMLTKGVFNMWEEPGRTLIQLRDQKSSFDRDRFFEDLKEQGIDTIVVVGVAADFCVKWAVDGLIAQGFNVEIPRDLTAGIVRDIDTVVLEDYAGQTVTVV